MLGSYPVNGVTKLLPVTYLGAGYSLVLASIYYFLKERLLYIIFPTTAFIFSSINFFALLSRENSIWHYFNVILSIIIPLLILVFLLILSMSGVKEDFHLPSRDAPKHLKSKS